MPFPIPSFRSSTENNLAKGLLIDIAVNIMVQTLATMLMTFVPKPSLRHCQVVSQSLHGKFSFLGDESSEVNYFVYLKYHNYFYLCQNSWKWFIYTRTQNVNRNHNRSTSSDGPTTKKSKFSDPSKHAYPVIPDGADDDESVKRNFALLKEESLKSKPRHEVLKDLLARTFPARRRIIFGSTGMFVADILTETPILKKGTYVRVAC